MSRIDFAGPSPQPLSRWERGFQEDDAEQMKPQPANDIDVRRAVAKRTALIIGAIAVFLFAISIIEVAIQK